MMDFLKKVMDWILEKEQDIANDCKIDPKDLDKQITYVEKRRDAIKAKYKDDLHEMEHILSKLHSIKANSLKCNTKA